VTGSEGAADRVTRLDSLADDLLAKAAAVSAHRAAQTLIAGGAPLRQTVIALTDGGQLSEHENPGYATLQVLRGRVRLVAGESTWELWAAAHIRIPDRRHSLHAEEDCVVLLTVAPRPD
jgi:quercetin dioxygenase-like cupin family protein